MSDPTCPPDERRNQIVAGVLAAATVLLVGYASGYGHVLGALTPPMPFSASKPGPGGSAAGEGSSTGDRHATGTSRVGTGSASASASQADGHAAAGSSTASGLPGSGLPGVGGSGGPDGPGTPAGASCTTDLASAMATPFWTHVQKAHLEASPSEQVADALNTDRYVRTHTVLLQELLNPSFGATSDATAAAETFWRHVQNGHLETSPGQQVQEVSNTDQYVRTHTVLLEQMLAPAGTTLIGTCR